MMVIAAIISLSTITIRRLMAKFWSLTPESASKDHSILRFVYVFYVDFNTSQFGNNSVTVSHLFTRGTRFTQSIPYEQRCFTAYAEAQKGLATISDTTGTCYG